MDAAQLDANRHVPDRGPAVFAVTTVTLTLASVFVFARMVCRYFIVKNISCGDLVMLLAWLIAFFLSMTVALGTFNGLGKYDKDIDQDDLPRLRRCEYIFSILYNPALMAVKTSILIFYLRVAKDTQHVLRYASWVALFIINTAGLVLTFMNIFQCSPIQAAWKAFFPHPAKCIPLLTEFICASPVNVVTDLAILALPIPVLTGMKLPSRQKTILILTFTMGIFVTIVDVVRIYYLQQAIELRASYSSATHGLRFGADKDFAYNASLSLMWSVVEVNVGVVCACIPALKPLVIRLLPAMLYDPNRSRTVTNKSAGPSDRESECQGMATAQHSTGPATPQPAALPPVSDISSSEDETPATGRRMHTNETNRDSLRPASRVRSNVTSSANTTSENAVYFGFVNMKKPKSMLKTSLSESFKYGTLVAILFFLWGFSYGLLNTLNSTIATANNVTTAEKLGFTSAYFGGGYFFGPLLVGEWILRRNEHSRSKRHARSDGDNIGGYKATFILGLCIYGFGAIMFWPSAVTNSYGGFMLSNFVVGFGLSVLEVAANSFMVLCGPPEYGEMRLLLAQAVQAIGSVLSAVLAHSVFFAGLEENLSHTGPNLINVQWTYLGITLLCAALGLFFFYMPLPEVSERELEDSTRNISVRPEKRSLFGLQLRTVILSLAVLAQYLYVAIQECNIIWFGNLITADAADVAAKSGKRDTPAGPVQGLTLSVSDYLLCGQGAFALSRILASLTCFYSVRKRFVPRPRTLMTICIVTCFISSLLLVVLRPSNSNLIVIPAIFFFFGEGPMWPLIFAIGLRGQGRRTKRAAAFLTMGGSGPAFFPFVMYGIVKTGGDIHKALIVIVALQGAMLICSGFLDISKDAKSLIDQEGPLQRSRRRDVEDQTSDVIATETLTCKAVMR